MGDWKDILSGKEEHANDEELIKYLEGKLSDEEKNAFEQKTADSDFVNDAIEGLSQFDSKQKLKEQVEQLNKTLHKQLDQRKKRRNKLKLKDNPWILVAVLLILAIAIIAFVVIRMNNVNSSQTTSIIDKTNKKILSQNESVQHKSIWHIKG